MVQITEKELEDYLCSNNNLKKHLGLRFVARQVPVVGAGFVDILAYNKFRNSFVIIELKKESLNWAAFFQIQRYYHRYKTLENYKGNSRADRKFEKLLIGQSLSPELDYAVEYYQPAQFFTSDRVDTYYRCFGISLEKPLSFCYCSSSQEVIEND